MTGVGSETDAIWLLVVVLGLGTFGLRLSFIHLSGRLDDIPPRIERGLDIVPAAILAALVCSELFATGQSVVGTAVGPRGLAAGLAAVVAWRTGSMLATIVGGMTALYTLQFVVG